MFKSFPLAAAAIGMLVIAGCASSSTSSSPAATQAAAGGSGARTTVEVGTVSGTGTVLVDGQGRTLYLDDQENQAGKILCSSSDCTAIWMPLLVPAGQTPTAPATVTGKLATIARPGGKTQVTLNGAPLYTFLLDHGAGKANGDGQSDSFDGTSFTWHAVTPAGAAATAPTTTTNGGGYGGY
jgi:predicted lipoprotein with Yx(FWY)xxD motif